VSPVLRTVAPARNSAGERTFFAPVVTTRAACARVPSNARANAAGRDIHHFARALSYPPSVSRACARMRVHANHARPQAGVTSGRTAIRMVVIVHTSDARDVEVLDVSM
jgi:hypothetical protein